MAKKVTIATFSVSGFEVDAGASLKQAADACEQYWTSKFAKVLPDRPDLIVMPECASRPSTWCGPRNSARLNDYYLQHGDRLMDLCTRTAVEHKATVVFSGVRLLDGGLYNCSTVISPQGKTLGVYCKNHLVIEENEQSGIIFGDKAEVIDSPVGRLGCMICFDLNFDELRDKYRAQRPDLLVFSSMYHGGGQQVIWPYLCRAHFVGAMGVPTLPAQIRNPFGEVLHSTTNYLDSVVGQVNLDCRIVHLDYNWEKLDAVKKHYGRDVTIHDPGLYGTVLITSESSSVSVDEMVRQFGIEVYDDYMTRARACLSRNYKPQR
jgi:predicted amidohydrolase